MRILIHAKDACKPAGTVDRLGEIVRQIDYVLKIKVVASNDKETFRVFRYNFEAELFRQKLNCAVVLIWYLEHKG